MKANSKHYLFLYHKHATILNTNDCTFIFILLILALTLFFCKRLQKNKCACIMRGEVNSLKGL